MIGLAIDVYFCFGFAKEKTWGKKKTLTGLDKQCNLPGKLFNGQPYNAQSLSCDSEWFSSLGKWTLLWDCAQGFKSGAACVGVPKMPKVTITWPVEPQSGN